jgi:hypothetical protein
MTDLRLERGYLAYPGRERYSLGDGVTALPAADLLSKPTAILRL